MTVATLANISAPRGFVLANLDTRSLLADRTNTPIVYGSFDLATNHAIVAQEFTSTAHAVVPVDHRIGSLPTTLAPWFFSGRG